MIRTTIMLPEKLKIKAANRAKEKGVTLGEFIRNSLQANLKNDSNNENADSFFTDEDFYEGDAPHNLAESHDQYLYGKKIGKDPLQYRGQEGPSYIHFHLSPRSGFKFGPLQIGSDLLFCNSLWIC